MYMQQSVKRRKSKVKENIYKTKNNKKKKLNLMNKLKSLYDIAEIMQTIFHKFNNYKFKLLI